MSNSTLRAQQQALQQAICARQAAAPNGLLQAGGCGLAVYQDAYSARLLAALRDNYTVLQRALGDAGFDALGLAFIDARPSTRPSIRWFGDGLADFMAGAYADRLDHPGLVDLARMDWALRAAFDSADAPCLSAARLARVAADDWPGLVFSLHPSVRLLALNWAVEPAWQALRAEDGHEEAEAPTALDHHLLIWRHNFETRWRSLQPLEAGLLQALAARQDFAAVCELAAETVGAPTAPVTVVQHLHAWLAEGLLQA